MNLYEEVDTITARRRKNPLHNQSFYFILRTLFSRAIFRRYSFFRL